MASVRKKTYTDWIPKGAKIVKRKDSRGSLCDHAKFRKPDSRGRMRDVFAKVVQSGAGAGKRCNMLTDAYYIFFNDENEVPRQKKSSTDKDAAYEEAAEITRRIERLKAGILDSVEIEIANQAKGRVWHHLDDYIEHLKAERRSEDHIYERNRQIKTVLKACGFATLAQVSPTPVERWINSLDHEETGTATRNSYIRAVRAFLNWAVKVQRMPRNPLESMELPNEEEDVRRERRAFTREEFALLVSTARLRPIAELGRERQKVAPSQSNAKRSNWQYVPLTPATIMTAYERAIARIKPELIEKKKRLGIERAAAYQFMVMTGLRCEETADTVWGNIDIDGNQHWLTTRADISKNSKTTRLPIGESLVQVLRDYRDACEHTGYHDNAFPNTPSLKVMNADMKAAGIEKVAEDGTTFDRHCLRHTYCTWLGKTPGISDSERMELMRVSDPEILRRYTYVKGFDLHNAIAQISLPDTVSPLALDTLSATGTDGQA